MAIISKTNSYFKILAIENDLIANSSQITCMVYETEEDRNREKILEPLSTTFVNNARDYIYNLEQDLQAIARNEKDFENIDSDSDLEQFLKDHPDINEKNNELQDKSRELNELCQQLLTADIDIDTLKYKDLWTSMGFTLEMCKKINRYLIKAGFDHITDTVNMPLLYDQLKTRIENPIDC